MILTILKPLGLLPSFLLLLPIALIWNTGYLSAKHGRNKKIFKER